MTKMKIFTLMIFYEKKPIDRWAWRRRADGRRTGPPSGPGDRVESGELRRARSMDVWFGQKISCFCLILIISTKHRKFAWGPRNRASEPRSLVADGVVGRPRHGLGSRAMWRPRSPPDPGADHDSSGRIANCRNLLGSGFYLGHDTAPDCADAAGPPSPPYHRQDQTLGKLRPVRPAGSDQRQAPG